MPPGFSIESYFEKVTRDGFAERLEVLDPLAAAGRLRRTIPEYAARLDKEIGVIRRVGFAGYFLIVWDFIRYAREHGVPVGPGRGSAAGSLVAYSLRITDIDPIEHDLIFERFLNEERISPPDIDIDFCENRRGEVIEYVTKKYGRENVAQIITFGTMGQAVVRLAGARHDLRRGLQDAKMIPFDLEPWTGAGGVSAPAGRPTEGPEGHVADLHLASAEGRPATPPPKPPASDLTLALTDLVPRLFKGGSEGLTTQYDMKGVERIGLLKMDFLGLRTLTLIDNCVKMIARQTGEQLAIDLIPVDDLKTYEMFTAGRTSGLFQFESDGMRDILKRFKPDRLEHLTALNALYRPGPMAMIDDVVKRRHGQTKVSYDHPLLEPILSETYGIMFYQSVMRSPPPWPGYTSRGPPLRKAGEEGHSWPPRMAVRRVARRSVPRRRPRNLDYIEHFPGYVQQVALAATPGSPTICLPQANIPRISWPRCSRRARQHRPMVQYIGEAGHGIASLPPDCNQSQITSRRATESRAGDSLAERAGVWGVRAAPPAHEDSASGWPRSRTWGRARWRLSWPRARWRPAAVFEFCERVAGVR